MSNPSIRLQPVARRYFIGGSDARIIIGEDETALLRLWREKRGEIEPEDLSDNLIVQLGLVTENLNRRWYEANTAHVITDVQHFVLHPTIRWMGATLDGRVQGSEGRVRGQVHAAVVVLGGSGGGEIHASTPAQHVGGGGTISGPVGDHWRRQMGWDHHPCRPALSAPHYHR
jgi:predicted phage-related endonuclease